MLLLVGVEKRVVYALHGPRVRHGRNRRHNGQRLRRNRVRLRHNWRHLIDGKLLFQEAGNIRQLFSQFNGQVL